MAEAPKIPRIVRQRLLSGQAGARAAQEHLDADLLSAYAENSLPSRERSAVLNHLAVCEDCRDAAMLSLPESAMAAAPPARGRSLLPGWMGLRWAALATGVVLTIGVVLLNRNFEQAKVSQAPATSEQPARQVAAAPSSAQERKFESAQSEAKTPGFGGGVVADERTAKGTVENRTGKGYKADVGHSAKPRPAPAASFDRLSSFAAYENRGPGNQSTVPAASPATPSANAPNVINDKHEAPATAVGSVGKLMRVAPAPGVTAQSSAEIANAAGETQVAGKRSEADAARVREQEPSKKKTAPEAAPVAVGALAPSTQGGPHQTPLITPESVRSEAYFQSKDRVEANQEKLATTSSEPAMQWRIRAGRLQQSNDTGKTWQEVNVAPGVKLHAFWTQGSSVWAGGTAGSLFHITDAGKQAVRIPIKIGEAEVAETVVAVTFTDELNGTIMLDNNLVLQTTDGGKTWERR